MLWKLVLVATLAVGVFGRIAVFNPVSNDGYDPYDEYSQLVANEYCTAMHAEQEVSKVKSAIKTFSKCIIGLFDPDTMKKDMEEVTNSLAYDGIIRKYCAKAPQLKACASDLVVGMTPCLPPGLARTGGKNVDTMIDFVCDNDGARVSSFVNEGGPQCVQEKQLDIAFCQQAMKSNITNLTNGGGVASSLAISDKDRCSITDQGLMCLVNALKGCANAVPGKLVQELHDVYLESMSCSEVSQDLQKVVGSELDAQKSGVSTDVEELKKKKLELEVRIAELEMWNRENELNVQHTVLTSDIKAN